MNTGWVGGPYGVGERIEAFLHARDGQRGDRRQLDEIPGTPHPVFGVMVPRSCPGMPDEELDARAQWKDAAAYDHAARDLAGRFRKNFAKFGDVDAAIAGAAPAA